MPILLMQPNDGEAGILRTIGVFRLFGKHRLVLAGIILLCFEYRQIAFSFRLVGQDDKSQSSFLAPTVVQNNTLHQTDTDRREQPNSSSSDPIKASVKVVRDEGRNNNHRRSPTKIQKKGYLKFVVGYPKSGTTSIYNYFNCSGVVTQHYCSGGDTNASPPCEHMPMAHCIVENLAKKRPMLRRCGDYEVYAQIDGERPLRRPHGVKKWSSLMNDGSVDSETFLHFLPQHFFLEKLHKEYPTATYILPLRDPRDWANSVMRWYQMSVRFVNEYWLYNSTFKRPHIRDKATRTDWLAMIYEEHTQFVRDFVRKHPSHALVEVNISDPNAGIVMQNAFGHPASCWGHANKFETHETLLERHNNPQQQVKKQKKITKARFRVT
jgi:hypothetical protein